MEEMFEFDEDAFAEAFQVNMGEEDVFDLMTSIMNPSISSLESNLSLFGYADLASPSQINIYPRNFESKQAVLDILEDYNNAMEANGEPERVVRFIDMVGIMMSSVTDIVDLVSYALIAFVSISLVVSSIMIGVITFISVLERKKEIGILRAIGASKQNIKLVFNAETLIIGFVAGVLGVLITQVVVMAANVILYNRLEIENLAQLPLVAAVILVGVSMFLTYIAGLMPASAAARKNPVEALRSE
jgi:ABC-type antimicrobial peptide transport system permease subunit